LPLLPLMPLLFASLTGFVVASTAGSSVESNRGELSSIFLVIFFFAAGCFFLPGSCSDGSFTLGPREQSLPDCQLSIADLPVPCYDEIGREYFH
jgi:hypothetical protein